MRARSRPALCDTERETYEAMWGVPQYAAHSPGADMVPLFADIVHTHVGRALPGATVLDAGCGSGKGALALQAAGLTVTMCDLTPAGLVPEAATLPFHAVSLWDDVVDRVGSYDFVYCCDVLEHVPPTLTLLVAYQLLKVARKGAFFSISLVQDAFGAWVGKPLHQSVQSFTQWRDQLDTIGDVVEARDLLVCGVYYVRAK